MLAEQADALGLELVVHAADEDDLARALEQLDPEIFLLSSGPDDDDGEPLERLLALLPDVPAGKLAIAELSTATRGRRRGSRARRGRCGHRLGRPDRARGRLDARGVIASGRNEASAPSRSAAAGRPTTGELLALAGVLVVAAGLRLAGSRYGLPEPLLNPDEANIVPRAWDLVHGGGLDPGWYDYPSLLMLVLAPTQVLAADPSYGAARVGALAIGLLGVLAVWWLGRVAYGTKGRARRGGRRRRRHDPCRVLADGGDRRAPDARSSPSLWHCSSRVGWSGPGSLPGWRASAKYPGVALLVPLAVASWGSWRRGARALGAGGRRLRSDVTVRPDPRRSRLE